MTTLVRTADVVPQPWRNGGGRTRELLAWPAASADWRVRVSVAEIEADGPFSMFPGARRWFAVLKGAGVELTIDGAPRRATRNDAPISFDGAAPTACRLLDGPTLDLNLMLRNAPGRMLAAADGVEWLPTLAQCGLYTAVAGRCLDAGDTIDVPAHALLWFERAPRKLRFEAAQRPAVATAWWLEAVEPASEMSR
jgi:uncharacterized protein